MIFGARNVIHDRIGVGIMASLAVIATMPSDASEELSADGIRVIFGRATVID
jgi:hypothetical protein